MILGALFFLSPLFAQTCYLSSEQEEKLLQMPYYDFDQTENGWRHYANTGCYQKMGRLIDRYLEKNKTALVDWQKIAITWHAGQLFAFNNDYETAKVRFHHALDKNEGENPPLLWNDYVYATLAFLDKDRNKLELHREKIAKGPIINGKRPNLEVVDNLLLYFDQPYSFAYAGRVPHSLLI